MLCDVPLQLYKNYLYLEFDPEKLNGDRDSYLDEICTIGRTVLMEHYSKLVENISTVRQIVDNVKFDDISISSNILCPFSNKS